MKWFVLCCARLEIVYAIWAWQTPVCSLTRVRLNQDKVSGLKLKSCLWLLPMMSITWISLISRTKQGPRHGDVGFTFSNFRLTRPPHNVVSHQQSTLGCHVRKEYRKKKRKTNFTHTASRPKNLPSSKKCWNNRVIRFPRMLSPYKNQRTGRTEVDTTGLAQNIAWFVWNGKEVDTFGHSGYIG